MSPLWPLLQRLPLIIAFAGIQIYRHQFEGVLLCETELSKDGKRYASTFEDSSSLAPSAIWQKREL